MAIAEALASARLPPRCHPLRRFAPRRGGHPGAQRRVLPHAVAGPRHPAEAHGAEHRRRHRPARPRSPPPSGCCCAGGRRSCCPSAGTPRPRAAQPRRRRAAHPDRGGEEQDDTDARRRQPPGRSGGQGVRRQLQRTNLPRAVLTGNPVRRPRCSASNAGSTTPRARRLLGVPEGRTLLLAYGGSLGARTVNRAVWGSTRAVGRSGRSRSSHVIGDRGLGRARRRSPPGRRSTPPPSTRSTCRRRSAPPTWCRPGRRLHRVRARRCRGRFDPGAAAHRHRGPPDRQRPGAEQVSARRW